MTDPLTDCVERLAALVGGRRRQIVGITGPPGAGKSSFAERLVAALNAGVAAPVAVLVPMDGFHLDDRELDRLHRRERKGAMDTFDAAGYVHLLRRLRSRADEVVYAPVFRREAELAVAGALPVHRDVPLVLTEGNYLLSDGAFAPVRSILDECWYVDVPDESRVERLVARHVRHGRSDAEARRWVRRVDEANARLVAATRHRADRVLDLTNGPAGPAPGTREAGS